jgi:sterol desaturase/sphingolipid hydroxylase (fatty acid hydroxylase superfamily)
MPDMDTAAWYALGVPLYVVYVVVEILIARRRPERVFGFAETIANLTAGLGTLVIGLFVGPWVLRAWDFAHDRVAPFPWPVHGWWKLPAALVLADFCYYVYHRAGHRFGILWSIHGIHHQHEHLNSSVGFRLEWLADPYAALFFGLMPLSGVDSTTGFGALMLLSIYALTAHSSVIGRPSLGFLITPAIHGAHHSRDARFAEKNYGAMLGIWDRLFGTWLEPARGDVMRADVPSISRTHDGVRTQWGLIAELVQAVARATTVRAKLAVLFSAPAVRGPSVPLREDAEIGRPTRVYVLVQFVGLAALGAWLLLAREVRPLPVQVGAAVTIIVGLHALGGLLDGRRRALRFERVRLLGTAAAGAALATYSLVGVPLVALVLGGLVHSLALSSRLSSPAEGAEIGARR